MKCLIPLLTQVVVLTKFGVFPVKAEFLCNFPETVAEVQPDGSTKCVCDTSRGFCGQKEDTCYPITCTGNKLLQRSCECVCRPDYVESIVGKCIPRQPTRVTPTCKDGEVVLPNGQCGLSTTTKAVTTTTTSSPPVLESPFEVNVTKIGSTYAILCVREISSGGNDSSATIAVWLYRTLDEFPMWYRKFEIVGHNITKIPILDLNRNTSYKLAIRISPDKEGKEMDGYAHLIPIHTNADDDQLQGINAYYFQDWKLLTSIIVPTSIGLVGFILIFVASCFWDKYEGLQTETKNLDVERDCKPHAKDVSAVFVQDKGCNTETFDNERKNIIDELVGNSKHNYSPLSQTEEKDDLDDDAEDRTSLKLNYKLRSSGLTIANDSSVHLLSDFSSCTVGDETKPMKTYVETSSNYDSYHPNDITCSHSYRSLSQPDQTGHTDGGIYNTDDCDYCRPVVSNARAHGEDVTGNENAQPQTGHLSSFNSIQRPGGTQPISS